MHTVKSLSALLLATTLLAACNGPTQATEQATERASGTYCFLHAVNKDTIAVSLTLEGDSVKGTMRWQPWEKDGANGELTGVRQPNGELDLLYNYVIEGSSQSETKIMRVTGDILLVKTGPLVDPNHDGNLRYQDVRLATFSDTLRRVSCPD